MLKRIWSFVKENVAAIITIATALLTIVYAILRLCIYIYWKGYFGRLNIDASIMSLNFDNSIYLVIFISVILLIVLFFMSWVYEVVNDIVKKDNELKHSKIKKICYKPITFCKIVFISFVILSMINLSLVIFLVAMAQAKVTIVSMMALWLVLYVIEMFFLISYRITTKEKNDKEKRSEKNIPIVIIEVLLVTAFGLSILFYCGAYAIEEKTQIQLVENEQYAITYCDGEHYVLHKVKFDGEVAAICKYEQKIVNIEDCEIYVKKVNKVIIEEE